HIDMYETGEHVARLLLQMADGQARYAVQWQRLPLLCHTLRSTTLTGAMKQVVDGARQAEAGGIPAATVFAGFPLADIEAPCMSVVVTGHADAAGAERARTVAGRIAQEIWAQRKGFIYHAEPLARSLERARTIAEGADKPVLLLDHGDNCMSGGTCDTTDVLQAALQAGLRDIAVGPIADPASVAAMFAAGVGHPCELRLGNKVSLSRLGLSKTPLRVSGTVRALSDGTYTVTGPIYTGQRCSMGRTAVLDTGAARIVVSELPHEPWDLGVFTCVDVDVSAHRFVLLKSRMYCRPVFEPLSAALVECDSAGVTSSDYGLFRFERLLRPVYPLDEV
ncbi:MAG TPA: MlrC C-terminal domain-containing protein, partial [Ramlibacter sp.]